MPLRHFEDTPRLWLGFAQRAEGAASFRPAPKAAVAILVYDDREIAGHFWAFA